jgi:protein gp37
MTTIEWTNESWNPTTGCDRISPGCDNCYALTWAARLKAMGSARYQRDGDPRTSGPGFGLTLHPDKLDQPLHWRKPRRVFVNSMSDVGHKAVPEEFIGSVFDVMGRCPQHSFQVLTKRPKRMSRVVRAYYDGRDPLPNVWLGTSIENADYVQAG